MIQIRVTNVKGDSDFRATEDELRIPIHRNQSGPYACLGNPFVMKNYGFKERERVIEAYRIQFETEVRQEGSEIQRVLKDLVKEYVEHQKPIALDCFCAPMDCHGHVIQNWLINAVEKELKRKNKTENFNCSSSIMETESRSESQGFKCKPTI